MSKRARVVGHCVFLVSAALVACRGYGGAPVAVDQQVNLVRDIRTVREGGGRLDWNPHTGLVAFDMVGPDGYYDVYTMKADGSDVRPLTAGIADLPKRHVAQPAWHPSGKYLVVQCEKEEHPKTRLARVVEPGAGVYNDLWLVVLDSRRAFPLRVVPAERGHGVLHAHFSEDGKRLSWSEMYRAGSLKGKRNLLGWWKLMVADFSFTNGKPHLDNVRSFEPGGPAFYENHGFSPDGKKLLFTSNFEAVSRINSHIYTLDLADGRLERLTDGKDWNEHASYSPDGRHIVWIRRNTDGSGTDYWIMKSDGTDKRRLTYFNEFGHDEHTEGTVVVADVAWSPDGKSILAYKRLGSGLEHKDSPRSIVRIDLDLDNIERTEGRTGASAR